MKNEYEPQFGGTTIIFVWSKGKRYEVLIDSKNFDKVNSVAGTWFMNKSGYIWTKGPRPERKLIFLHRLIMNVTKHEEKVDHINHNKHNNLELNLRIVTNSENMQNRSGINKNNVSGYRGVIWNSKHGKWQAQAKVNRKQTYLGLFEDKEEAAKVASDFRRRNNFATSQR